MDGTAAASQIRVADPGVLTAGSGQGPGPAVAHPRKLRRRLEVLAGRPGASQGEHGGEPVDGGEGGEGRVGSVRRSRGALSLSPSASGGRLSPTEAGGQLQQVSCLMRRVVVSCTCPGFGLLAKDGRRQHRG